MEKATTVEQFLLQNNGNLIDCPICNLPIKKSSCDARQKQYPPIRSNGQLTPNWHMSGCSSTSVMCPHYRGPRAGYSLLDPSEVEELDDVMGYQDVSKEIHSAVTTGAMHPGGKAERAAHPRFRN